MDFSLDRLKRLHADAVENYLVVRRLHPNPDELDFDIKIESLFESLQEFSDEVDRLAAMLTSHEQVSAFSQYIDRWPMNDFINAWNEAVEEQGSFDPTDPNSGYLRILDNLILWTGIEEDFGLDE